MRLTFANRAILFFISIGITMGPAYGQPVISPASVINAATYAPMGGPGAGLAQGSFISIYGTGFAAAGTSFTSGIPLSTSVTQTSVTVTPAAGSAVQAYIDYLSPTQINAILPSNTPLGAANVTVTFNGQTSPPIKINVVASNFGIFTAAYGAGPAATINPNSTAFFNYFTNASNPGQALELYGTGLGPISVPDNNLPGAVSPPNINVQVLVGNQLITPFYAGRSPSLVGVDQINFYLPPVASFTEGCFVPISIIVNGVASNFGTLSLAANGLNCPAPFGLTTNAIQNLQVNAGVLQAGFLNISDVTTEVSSNGLTLDGSVESAGAIFSPEDALGLLGLNQTLGGVPPIFPVGSCTVETINAPTPPTSTTPPVSTELNAGSPLVLNGPNGKTANLPFSSTGYTATLAKSALGTPPPTFLTPGVWTMTGPGGPDVGAFSASITVPTPLTCTNCSNLNTIDRTKPLTITWSGGGGSQDWVEIGGISTAPLIANTSNNVATIFLCAAHASDQTFTVPTAILSQLPPAEDNPLATNFGTLVLVNMLGSGNSFTAPLTGGKFDLSFFNYSTVFLRVVGFN
jgi:uncharacterized protein (TIGR03437 family)